MGDRWAKVAFQFIHSKTTHCNVQNWFSAAGKTQLALQLSLTVQLPPDKGGLSGSACYLTTSAKLPTSRLVEMTKTHPQLSAPFCSLSDVHTISTSNIPLLLHVLSDLLPKLILERTRPSFKPVKLLVIDALAELFHSSDKTTTQTLVERSRNLYEISSLLHNIASQHEIAILVLNEVGDAFDRSYGVDTDTDLVYSDQSRWFGRADSVPGESRKEASLGLVWANQVNVRILLSRTGRRRYLDDVRSVGNKLRKVDGVFDSMENSHAEPGEDTSTLVRRLSVIFSSIAPAVSLDYTVTMEGISVLQELPGSRELRTVTAPYSDPKDHNAATLGSSTYESRLKLCPLDVGSCTNNVDSGQVIQGELPADDDEEQYWENNDVPEYAYSSLALDSILSQSNP